MILNEEAKILNLDTKILNMDAKDSRSGIERF